MEGAYSDRIIRVNPIYRKSAQNLIHYLAFRTFENPSGEHCREAVLTSGSASDSSTCRLTLITVSPRGNVNGASYGAGSVTRVSLAVQVSAGVSALLVLLSVIV